MLSINRDELKMVLDKLCKIASSSPEDAGASELKFTAEGSGVLVQAANITRHITARYLFSGGSCNVDEPVEFCVPAVSLRDSVKLLKGDNVEFTLQQRSISVRGDGDDTDDGEHCLIGMQPSGWNGAPLFNNEQASFTADRSGLVGVAKFTSFSCMADTGQAPLTAIRVTVTAGGDLKGLSADQGRTSVLSLPGMCKDIRLVDGDEHSFMLPPAAATLLAVMFGQEYSDIFVKSNSKRILFQAGGLSFDISAEAGIDIYPRQDTMLIEDSGFVWTVDLEELRRATNLVGIVAEKHLAKVEFTKAGKIVISGRGSIEKGSKSRQTISPTSTDGNLFDENSIEVACVDLIEALKVPTSDQVNIGLRNTTTPAINPVLLIEQDTNVSWKHMMLRSVNVD